MSLTTYYFYILQMRAGGVKNSKLLAVENVTFSSLTGQR